MRRSEKKESKQMNLEELKLKLSQARIRQDFYSLFGSLPNEAFCIDKVYDEWQVYYSEHGSKSKKKIFSTENEACDYFYEWITSDEVVMNNLNNC